MKHIKLLFFFMALNIAISNSQILQVTPAFPTVDDYVTIIYDATQGNGALTGVSPVYAHAGLITDESSSPTDWKFIKFDWDVNDPSMLLTDLGDNKHKIEFGIKDFYGLPEGTNVLELAFVFRNAAGSIVGRSTDGSDIYYPVYPVDAGFLAAFFRPVDNLVLVDVDDTVSIYAESNSDATLSLYDNGDLITSLSDTTMIEYDHKVVTAGVHLVELVADDGVDEVRDTFYYAGRPVVEHQDPPAGMLNGINYINDSTVLLQLFAPNKEFVYVTGDFNNWLPDTAYSMSLSDNDSTWWLEITHLTPGEKYAFQYWVDGEIKIADPFSELILDPSNDPAIDSQTYPDPHPYPTGKTSGRATLIQPGKPPYVWQVTDFQAPEKTGLVIYELLVRDFLAAHNYQTLKDTMDYLENLGINAIELMPPGEFEGNESWGYNPSYHMALDKYYGTPDAFKALIDECHSRGIAVIVDMVLNHAYGQSPLVQLYWDALNGRPAADNPWLNAVCPHEPYCWGYDFNHESKATQDFVDRVTTYWLTEYNIDGFRFDFTKGFTNAGNVGYDLTRINLLKRMADTIWKVNPDAYVILEHWADNSEETILSDYGMMLWGNVTYNYQEASMGWITNSNFQGGIYKQRGWDDQHLVTYMESHDEERLMYKNLQYGNSDGSYSVMDLITALRRIELTAAFLYTIPGPKMLFQFGEIGYDVSIDYDCRVCNKPILWNYFEEANRRHLYDVISALIHLRREHEMFSTDDFSWSLNNAAKRINLNNATMNAVILGNFAVTQRDIDPQFQSAGWWYEYFSGDSLSASGVNDTISLQPGEYRVYTSERLSKPDITEDIYSIPFGKDDIKLYPNPGTDCMIVSYLLPEGGDVNVSLVSEYGQTIKYFYSGRQSAGENQLELDVSELQPGLYIIRLSFKNSTYTERLIVD
jgi:1,4-alpha-glucan branching enzyme